MGWADNIILAMAPLGIITAIIRRAWESRAAAESKLMSSMLNEVCELWNGQEIVRVMGSGPIWELVILPPKGSRETTRAEKTYQEIQVMKVEDAICQNPTFETALLASFGKKT
ncbi:hypothetical protein B0T25DRAFT_550972 [Lasiosphaeria hispida]|uniref:Uncharacterized protein n=1 Tax=Lasiosphaeria hispida TaxID=260671 RepID=A0AAJ0HAL9_9PEZI|nr:hypothetical protein B0T25DRAFT_550972 [Lasiosphaeria hispida]